MRLSIGVDAGGTFTDMFVRDTETGDSYSHKLPSTPQNPADAIVDGIDHILDRFGLDASSVELIAHGTTVGTNTLLQRNGARVALVTTKGFRDLLEIGRQTRPINYNMHVDFPAPVVPRDRRFELDERVDADGNVVIGITQEELDRVLSDVLAKSPEAIAVCFLFGYLNSVHEHKVKSRIQSLAPNMFVSTSNEVQPEFREYERISTTAINAYLQPVMARYLDSLKYRLEEVQTKARVAISRSNGGLMSLPLARQFPIRTALSGPAAGVIGAIDVLKSLSKPNAITFDMGGTSADVALVRNFNCDYRHRSDIGGFPIRMAMLDIHTVGAGGGSIAWFDRDDLLKVGPRSAGAHPGPACYSLGGEEPTVTDANLVLGRLPPDGLLGGSMELHGDLARLAIEKISMPLGLSVVEGATGILDIVTANMVRAIRVITVERGFDPRELALLAFGGAGPLHARQVAVELGLREIVVPALPGILCAQGAVASTFREDMVRTVKRELCGTADLELIGTVLAELGEEAINWSNDESLTLHPPRTTVLLEIRYVGQNFELAIPLLPDETSHLPSVDTLRRRFFAEHDRQYGFHSEDGVIEVVNIRLTAEVPLPGSNSKAPADRTKSAGRHSGSRMVWFGQEEVPALQYSRRSLVPGQKLTGPAVIDQADTTTLIFPGDTVLVDDHLNLIIGVNP